MSTTKQYKASDLSGVLGASISLVLLLLTAVNMVREVGNPLSSIYFFMGLGVGYVCCRVMAAQSILDLISTQRIEPQRDAKAVPTI